jgi:hypothetical protein
VNGTFEVILPAHDYRQRIVSCRNVNQFDELLVKATAVTFTQFAESGADAYTAANQKLLARTNFLFAVWDGSPHGKSGGTAETVAMAERMGVPVVRVWPPGTHRVRSVPVTETASCECRKPLAHRTDACHRTVPWGQPLAPYTLQADILQPDILRPAAGLTPAA